MTIGYDAKTSHMVTSTISAGTKVPLEAREMERTKLTSLSVVDMVLTNSGGSDMSMSNMSFEKRFRMRPMGVLSKKRAEARVTAKYRSRWRRSEARTLRKW